MEATMVHNWPRTTVETTGTGSATEATRSPVEAVGTGKRTDCKGGNANRYYEFLVHFCLLS